jgi:hypothetical protein
VTASFRVPSTFVRLWEYLLDGYEPAQDGPQSWDIQRYARKRGAGLLPELATLSGFAVPVPDSLDHEEPMELVQFAHAGDTLQYAWVVLAPELDLDDHPCVSYQAETDDLVWLGDDTRQALENALVGRLTRHLSEQERLRRRAAVPVEKLGPSPLDDPWWSPLCQALQLRPDIVSPQRTWKARWDREIQPTVPPGWRYEPVSGGVGVLAEADAFAPQPFTVDPDWYGEESATHAQRALLDGHPATALCIVKETHVGEPGVVETMRAAYQALGRTQHVERADTWLREWADERD